MYFLALNGVDAALTGLAINLGAVEANPFLSLVGFRLGLSTMLLFKVSVAVSLGGILLLRKKRSLLTKVNYLLVAVVAFNTLVITAAL